MISTQTTPALYHWPAILLKHLRVEPSEKRTKYPSETATGADEGTVLLVEEKEDEESITIYSRLRFAKRYSAPRTSLSPRLSLSRLAMEITLLHTSNISSMSKGSMGSEPEESQEGSFQDNHGVVSLQSNEHMQLAAIPAGTATSACRVGTSCYD